MELDRLLAQMKSILAGAFGSRLRGVVVYCSEARGESDDESDIDVLVLLTGPVDYGRDLDKCIHVLYPMVLELERPIDVTPVDIEVYNAQEFSLYRNVKREGRVA